MLDTLFPKRTYVLVDPQGRVVHSAACANCGYNLQTALAQTGCPECGDPAIVVDERKLLVHADAAWRQRLATGARWFRLGILFLPVGVGVAGVLAGLWQLTAPEPDVPEHRHDRGRRLAARWIPLVALLFVIAGMVAALIRRTPLHGDWLLSDLLVCVAFGLGLAGLIYAWRHIHGLAVRAGSATLANAARRAWGVWMIGCVLGTLLASAGLVLNRLSPMLSHILPFWAGALLILPVLAVLVWMGWHADRTAALLRETLRDPPAAIDSLI